MKVRCVDQSPWRLSWRRDPRGRQVADRHYNRQSVGHPDFMPPGRCLVLVTDDGSAVWGTSWPYAEYAQHQWAGAWVNSLFRNEGDYLSSDLIRHAVAHTRWNPRWRGGVPDLGFVSFVDEGEVRAKRDPGRCYRRAGWRHVGFTKTEHLWVFQQLPGEMPPAAPVPCSQMELFSLQPAQGLT